VHTEQSYFHSFFHQILLYICKCSCFEYLLSPNTRLCSYMDSSCTLGWRLWAKVKISVQQSNWLNYKSVSFSLDIKSLFMTWLKKNNRMYTNYIKRGLTLSEIQNINTFFNLQQAHKCGNSKINILSPHNNPVNPCWQVHVKPRGLLESGAHAPLFKHGSAKHPDPGSLILFAKSPVLCVGLAGGDWGCVMYPRSCFTCASVRLSIRKYTAIRFICMVDVFTQNGFTSFIFIISAVQLTSAWKSNIKSNPKRVELCAQTY